MKEDISWMYILWNSWFLVHCWLRSLCTNLLVGSNNKLLSLESPTGIKPLTSLSLQLLLWFPLTPWVDDMLESVKRVTGISVICMTTTFFYVLISWESLWLSGWPTISFKCYLWTVPPWYPIKKATLFSALKEQFLLLSFFSASWSHTCSTHWFFLSYLSDF